MSNKKEETSVVEVVEEEDPAVLRGPKTEWVVGKAVEEGY